MFLLSLDKLLLDEMQKWAAWVIKCNEEASLASLINH